MSLRDPHAVVADIEAPAEIREDALRLLTERLGAFVYGERVNGVRWYRVKCALRDYIEEHAIPRGLGAEIEIRRLTAVFLAAADVPPGLPEEALVRALRNTAQTAFLAHVFGNKQRRIREHRFGEPYQPAEEAPGGWRRHPDVESSDAAPEGKISIAQAQGAVTSIVERLEARAEFDRVLDCAELTQEQTALAMKVAVGERLADVARAQGVPKSTVRSQWRKIREKCKKASSLSAPQCQ